MQEQPVHVSYGANERMNQAERKAEETLCCPQPIAVKPSNSMAEKAAKERKSIHTSAARIQDPPLLRCLAGSDGWTRVQS